MKLRITTRTLPSNTNSHRPIPIYTLCAQRRNSILIRSTHWPRRKLRVTNTCLTRKWRIYILLIPISSHRTRSILQLIPPKRNMKHRSNYISINNSCSIYRLRTPMRTNKILRSNCNHKYLLSHPIRRTNTSRMNLRGLRCRQRHTKSILLLSFLDPIYPYRSICGSYSIPTPNRL